MKAPQTSIEKLRSFLEAGQRIVILTGAGISTESGISDYRSKGGIWDRFQPVTIQEFLADAEKRKLYWMRKKEMYAQMHDARPNAGHKALARLEERGKLLGLITQNIDGLHQLAGSQKVLEIHGTNREAVCLSCGRLDPFDKVYQRLEAGEEAPECPDCPDCGGWLKPNTISFGQALDGDVLNQAMAWARACDLMLVAGSTLVVEPAASLPRLSKQNGALLVIINRDATPLDGAADLVLHTSIGETLQAGIP